MSVDPDADEASDETCSVGVDSGFTLTPSGTEHVRRNAHVIANLPPAGECWTLRELRERQDDNNAPIPDHRTFASWAREGILDRVGMRELDHGKRCIVWTVTPVAHEHAQSIDEDTPHLHCCPDATGFRNLGDDEYECTNDECDVIHSRERIEAVFMDGA